MGLVIWNYKWDLVLFTASKAQESDLPQNKLHLSSQDKLTKVTNFLVNHELKDLFKAKGVAKDKSLSELLGTDVEKYILRYLEKEDIKTPSNTVNQSGASSLTSRDSSNKRRP